MFTPDIPERYRDLSPIIVTSPTTRCGTTLVQRLISSSNNAFIYGEEMGLQTVKFGEWLANIVQHLDHNAQKMGADFERALAGALDDWRPGLPPPPHVILRAALEVFYQFPVALAEHGPRIGRPLWGFKLPAIAPDMMRLVLALMPQAKVVYVFRHPFDALKSAKARKFVVSDAEREAFCAAWAANFNSMLDLHDRQRVLLLCYEALCDQQTAQCGALEAFTGAAGIGTREFDIKVNTFKGAEAEGRSPSQYIEPLPLTEVDRACVTAHAGALIERFYPSGRTLEADPDLSSIWGTAADAGHMAADLAGAGYDKHVSEGHFGNNPLH